jgi:hypothetical protein
MLNAKHGAEPEASEARAKPALDLIGASQWRRVCDSSARACLERIVLLRDGSASLTPSIREGYRWLASQIAAATERCVRRHAALGVVRSGREEAVVMERGSARGERTRLDSEEKVTNFAASIRARLPYTGARTVS